MHPALKATLFKGVGGFLPSFMAGQSDGFWYDFSKTDRLFQENVGPTPAATANDVIGLALSQRLWNGASLAAYLASQSELLSNGDFAAGATGWTTTSWVISGGAATITNVSDSLAQPVAFVAGRMYAVTYTLTGFAGSGAFRPRFFGGTTVTGSNRSVDGTYTDYMTAVTGNVTFAMTPSTATCSGTVDNISVKEISRYPATQSTTSLKPKYQATGAAFDGSDDNLLTGYLAGTSANFIVAKVTVPVSLPSAQLVAGATGAGALPSFVVGFNASGQLVGGVGNQSITAIVGASGDLRNTTAIIGLSFDGATVKLFANGAEVYSQPQSGGPPTLTVPLRIGCRNVDGAPQSFFGGSIKAVVAGRQFLDLATFNKIASQL